MDAGLRSPLRHDSRILLCLVGGAAILLASRPSLLASESKLMLKSDGSPDGYYYTLDDPSSPESRFITEYAAGDFDPYDLIVGARIAELNRGMATTGVLTAELRFEDPANPGFPDLSADALIAISEAGSEGACSSDPSFRREFTFEALEAPSFRTIFLAIKAPGGQSGVDACGIQLDSSSAPRGASKCYLGSTGEFLDLSANHLAEIRVERRGPQDLSFRAHGSPRYPGDPGLPIVYARRPSANPPYLTDDFLSLDFIVDNVEDQPVMLDLQVWAEPGEILPDKPLVNLTARVVGIEDTSRIGGVRSFAPGRTILRSVIRRVLPRRVLASLPARLPLEIRLLDPMLPGVPRDQERGEIGLRLAPGMQDSGNTDELMLVQSPSQAGDALAVRYPLADLPSIPFTVTAVELVGGQVGVPNLPGFDALELRVEDSIIPGSPDLSPNGLIWSLGVADGFGEVRVGPTRTTLTVDIPPYRLDPTDPTAKNLWAQVLLAAGDGFHARGATVLGADLNAPSLLGDSFYTLGGGLPYNPDITRNYQIRLLIDSIHAPSIALESRRNQLLPIPPDGFTASGGPRQISIIAIAGGGGSGR